jgi:hypothetical protein
MLPAPQRQGGIGKKNTAEPAPPNTVVFCNTFPRVADSSWTFSQVREVPGTDIRIAANNPFIRSPGRPLGLNVSPTLLERADRVIE